MLFANNCFAKMVQSPLEQVAGRSLAQFVGRDSRRRLSSLLAKAKRGPAEARIVLESGGASIPVHAWANLLDRPDGATICLVGVDLSQLETSKEMIQHLQEQRQVLAESEAALRKAQELAHIGSWTWEIQKRLVHPSDEMLRILGVGREEFERAVPEPIDRLIHPGDREQIGAVVRAGAAHGPSPPMEFRIVRPDGSIRMVWGKLASEAGLRGEPGDHIGRHPGYHRAGRRPKRSFAGRPRNWKSWCDSGPPRSKRTTSSAVPRR
ncbi:MAG: PAS domain-containing protein [Ignavibacteriales bacterium]|nr:PAS domain-containing protein [Ignavibacteriales bacterium]